MDTLAAVRDNTGETPCSLEAAAMQTRVIDALQQMPVHAFPGAACRTRATRPGVTQTFVPGLYDALRQGFEQGRLLSELNLPWA
jgi:hypothetical protein